MKTKSKRLANIEFLRILAMLMVVMLHYLGFKGFDCCQVKREKSPGFREIKKNKKRVTNKKVTRFTYFV